MKKDQITKLSFLHVMPHQISRFQSSIKTMSMTFHCSQRFSVDTIFILKDNYLVIPTLIFQKAIVVNTHLVLKCIINAIFCSMNSYTSLTPFWLSAGYKAKALVFINRYRAKALLFVNRYRALLLI